VHGGLEGLLDGDVDVLVLLLVVDDDVVHVAGKSALGLDLGRAHAVELADLGRALEHLHGVGVCEQRDTKHSELLHCTYS
jgi:hypothetical protein